VGRLLEVLNVIGGLEKDVMLGILKFEKDIFPV
jgi:hypothetical protein